MGDLSDAALAADGDYQAFERLFRRYVIRVYSLCARLSGSRKHGEELTREVFVRSWQKLTELKGGTSYSTWLNRLAIDVVLNAPRFDGGLPAGTAQGAAATERSKDVADLGKAADHVNLSQAIETLPDDPRRVFVLHDVERYNHEEIAEIFGTTVGRSKAHLRRARSLLLDTLAQ